MTAGQRRRDTSSKLAPPIDHPTARLNQSKWKNGESPLPSDSSAGNNAQLQQLRIRALGNQQLRKGNAGQIFLIARHNSKDSLLIFEDLPLILQDLLLFFEDATLILGNVPLIFEGLLQIFKDAQRIFKDLRLIFED